MSESVEDIAARLQRRIDLYGGRADFHALMKSYAELETSWRERGEALRKAKPVVEAVAELAKKHGAWAQGIPLNALDAINTALSPARPASAEDGGSASP